MTVGKKFKKKVRARMVVTGETYSQAKAVLENPNRDLAPCCRCGYVADDPAHAKGNSDRHDFTPWVECSKCHAFFDPRDGCSNHESEES